MGKLREKLFYFCPHCNVAVWTQKSELINHINKRHPGEEIKDRFQRMKLKKG